MGLFEKIATFKVYKLGLIQGTKYYLENKRNPKELKLLMKC